MSENDHFDPMDLIIADIQCYKEQNKINLVDDEHFIRYNYVDVMLC
jgi:hypothetical protein